MKQLDYSAAEEVFDELLEENGETTSLDVKQRLRKNGYWAEQAETTQFVRQIAFDKDLDWDFNGQYRTYFKESNSTKQNLVPASNTTASIPGVVKKFTDPANPADRLPINSPITGDWECTSKFGPTHYFIGKLSGPQARYAYSLIEGIPYIDVRSKLVN